MEDVNKAIPTNNLDPPTVRNTRIHDNLRRVENILNEEEERIMFQNISKRWFDRDDAEVDVAIMMAELKIERIKHDHSEEDSYLDAIAYLTMALTFMQEGEKC